MENLGGALLPFLCGRFADVIDPAVSYVIVILCYLFLLYYVTLGNMVANKIIEVKN